MPRVTLRRSAPRLIAFCPSQEKFDAAVGVGMRVDREVQIAEIRINASRSRSCRAFAAGTDESTHIQRGTVEIGKRNADIQTWYRDRIAGADVFPKQPTAIVLSGVVFDASPILMHDQIFAKVRDGPVHLEIFPAIMAFCGRRKDFDDEQRVENHIPLVACELRIAAKHTAVRVRV